MLNYAWISRGHVQTGTLCSVQGFFINFGDVGSSFWAASLAIHTFSLIVFSQKIKRMVTYSAVVVYGASFFLSLAGLLFQDQRGPFYANAGAWCWISPNYQIFRIYFHYGPMLIIAGCLILIYLALFINVYRRGRKIGRTTNQVQRQSIPASEATFAHTDIDGYDSDDDIFATHPHETHHESAVGPLQPVSPRQPASQESPNSTVRGDGINGQVLGNGHSGGIRLKSFSWSKRQESTTEHGGNSDEHQHSHGTSSRFLRIDHVARKLFLYPIVYVIIILPLAIYRLSAYAGVTLPFIGLLVVGTIFALAGAVNTMVYGLSRRLLPRWHPSRTLSNIRHHSHGNSHGRNATQSTSAQSGHSNPHSPMSLNPAIVFSTPNFAAESPSTEKTNGTSTPTKRKSTGGVGLVFGRKQSKPTVSFNNEPTISSSRASSISNSPLPASPTTPSTPTSPTRKRSTWHGNEHEFSSKEEYLRERRRGRVQDSIAVFQESDEEVMTEGSRDLEEEDGVGPTEHPNDASIEPLEELKDNAASDTKT